MAQPTIEQNQDATLILAPLGPQGGPASGPRLWLGNKKAAADSNFIRRAGINVVFNCTKDLPFSSLIPHQYRVPVHDNLEPEEIQNMLLWSPEIIAKLMKEYKRGGVILVHCHAGMQRSAAVVAMFIIALTGQPTEKVMGFIRSKRPIAFFPEANFKQAILGFEQQLRAEMKSRTQYA
jgi:hypothetical protein